ncbi:hypothetical protein PG994_008279 [Apiospora phragmitis]|uniref:Uncharacterized protein n=1 Tax=Apiospora phragmitis TaxID=2905665 RepID=A0ABR1USL6_9PEZI
MRSDPSALRKQVARLRCDDKPLYQPILSLGLRQLLVMIQDVAFDGDQMQPGLHIGSIDIVSTRRQNAESFPAANQNGDYLKSLNSLVDEVGWCLCRPGPKSGHVGGNGRVVGALRHHVSQTVKRDSNVADGENYERDIIV